MRHRKTLNRCLRGLVFLAALPVFPAAAASCRVSSAGLAFGGYDPFAALPLDSAAAITVSCDVAAPYTVALSSGVGSFMNRQMSGPTQVLRYNVYVDVPRLTVWGDGSASTTMVSGTTTPGRHTVYARMPARQNVQAGMYVDSLIITVTY